MVKENWGGGREEAVVISFKVLSWISLEVFEEKAKIPG